jgi:hypothetical protein
MIIVCQALTLKNGQEVEIPERRRGASQSLNDEEKPSNMKAESSQHFSSPKTSDA